MGQQTIIQKISPEEAGAIIETRQPLGLFYIKESGVYVGIDNSCGDAWTEDFRSLDQCKRWLRDPSTHKEVLDLDKHSLFSHVIEGAETGAAIGKCVTSIAGTIAGGLTGAAIGYLQWLILKPLEKLALSVEE